MACVLLLEILKVLRDIVSRIDYNNQINEFIIKPINKNNQIVSFIMTCVLLENNIFKVLRDTVSRMDNNNKEMSLVLGEYEKTITQLIQEFICHNLINKDNIFLYS